MEPHDNGGSQGALQYFNLVNIWDEDSSAGILTACLSVDLSGLLFRFICEYTWRVNSLLSSTISKI